MTALHFIQYPFQKDHRPCLPAGLVVSSLSLAGRGRLFLQGKTIIKMNHHFTLRRGSQLLATLLLFVQSHLLFADGHQAKNKAFPTRKSSMMQVFDFGFDLKSYKFDATQTGGTTYGATDYPTYAGQTIAMKGVCIGWTGSIMGSMIDTDQGFRFGDLVGARLDQGVGRQENYLRETKINGDDKKWNSSTYYGRIDFLLGLQTEKQPGCGYAAFL